MKEDIKNYNDLQSISEDRFNELYEYYEGINYHAENVVLKAGFRGTKEHHKKAVDLLDEQEKIGHLSSDLQIKRQDLLKDINTSYNIESCYSAYSNFKTKYDLRKVHGWYIKWDTLYILPNEGGEWIEVEKEYDNFEDFDVKRPSKVYQVRDDQEDTSLLLNDFGIDYTVYSLRWNEGGELQEHFIFIDSFYSRDKIKKLSELVVNKEYGGDKLQIFEDLLDENKISWRHFVYDIIES
jgi:hypothetical protein